MIAGLQHWDLVYCCPEYELYLNVDGELNYFLDAWNYE